MMVQLTIRLHQLIRSPKINRQIQVHTSRNGINELSKQHLNDSKKNVLIVLTLKTIVRTYATHRGSNGLGSPKTELNISRNLTLLFHLGDPTETHREAQFGPSYRRNSDRPHPWTEHAPELEGNPLALLEVGYTHIGNRRGNMPLCGTWTYLSPSQSWTYRAHGPWAFHTSPFPARTTARGTTTTTYQHAPGTPSVKSNPLRSWGVKLQKGPVALRRVSSKVPRPRLTPDTDPSRTGGPAGSHGPVTASTEEGDPNPHEDEG